MSLLSTEVESYIQSQSWIRKMFEAGAKMKAEFGEDQVCDFSLGNPDLPPPVEVKKAIQRFAETADQPLAVGYMPNAGYPWFREKLAAVVGKVQEVPLKGEDIVITCGAAGGLNALFRTILNPGDEILGLAPFFVEYIFYTQNYDGVFKSVPCTPPEFTIDLDAFEKAITPKTRAVLLNSPNNPSGHVYPKAELEALAAILTRKSEEFGRPILMLMDEPYRFLSFDGHEVPAVLPLYPYSVVINSFSKNLSLAGARIGYVAVNPDMPDKGTLVAGITLANRILGYVNAPAIGQHIAADALEAKVDTSIYDARRKAMAECLDNAGYTYAMPKGGFYFFPKAPGGDDVAFVAKLQEERILAVPGSGFGFPGYFRLAFCVDEAIIRRAKPGFAAAIKK